MKNQLTMSIGEVAQRTGLSERALRYYEAEGLLRPARTTTGRRIYAAAEMLSLARISLLKRVGFSIAQIRELTARGALDAAALVDAQADAMNAQLETLVNAIDVLEQVRRKLKAGEAADAETLCQLIKVGEINMSKDAWQKVYDRYYTPDEQAHWREAKKGLGVDFNQDALTKSWVELNDRIAAALPLDPASNQAHAFLAEWNKLLEPFMAAADETMKKGAAKIWANMDEWQGETQSPVSKEVYSFISEVAQVAKDSA